MNEKHQLAVCLVILTLCWRAAQMRQFADSVKQFRQLKENCSLVPHLATAPLSELALLPSLGLTRARCIVEQRHFFNPPLTAATIYLIDGVGETTAAELSVWYQAQRD